MKKNGNNQKLGDYYIGLDVGTNSVGWAATDKDYRLLKFHGKDTWGARLFDEAKTASERRTARSNRRRLARRRQRILLLETLFAEELNKVDPGFFRRLHDSFLTLEDKDDAKSIYTLFADECFTDKEYAKKYPSIYHLRSDLAHSKETHDIRLVYLALHHLLKHRGHFLYDGVEDRNGQSINDAIDRLTDLLSDSFECSFVPKDMTKFVRVLTSDDTVSVKKKNIIDAYGDSLDNSGYVNVKTLLELLTGAKVGLDKLFNDDTLKNADVNKISLLDDLESKADELGNILENRIDLITSAKSVFDIGRLGKILGSNIFLSDAKVQLFEKNKTDLRILKAYVRNEYPSEYKEIFDLDKKGLKNYPAYMNKCREEKCSQEEFCIFLKNKLKNLDKSKDSEIQRIFQEINDKSFLSRLKGVDNGLVPYQINLNELKSILHNAESYLPFLTNTDESGLTISQKIISIFSFRIPYYVGPLNLNAKNAWVKRSSERIYPWNFEEVVDENSSASSFMENLIGRCTYTGDPVLPLNSLLYSEYMVLNEINTIKVNEKPIPVDVKNSIYEDLFLNSKRKVTKKSIFNYLLMKGLIRKDDQITGIDDEVKSKLTSQHDLKNIIQKIGKDSTEEIINAICVFSENKKMLKRWLEENVSGLSDDDLKYILRLKYNGWGRLSKQFLDGIYSVDKNGEVHTIIECLRNTNKNLMQLLSPEYDFASNAIVYRREKYGVRESIKDQLDELYIAPAVRRGIWQTIKIVDELVDIKKSAPKKIFIEMARGSSVEMKKKRSSSRKKQLQDLYNSCKDLEESLRENLEKETDQTLRRDKLFLYYLQLGRCMYSGDPIDLEMALKDNEMYDIDHIYPRSKIKDDSLNNRVLVKSTLNRTKTDTYPIQEGIRRKMSGFWRVLHEKGLISNEKLYRLMRNSELTEEELASFVARQLNSTQQSTKALADMLKILYPNTSIVYSKAGNVSDFRQEFNLIKCREINDLHHAKDAYLNIVVGNVYDTRFTKAFFKNILHEKYSLKRVFDFDTRGAWMSDGTSINVVRRYMRKNSPIVTFKPLENKGMLFDLQIMPRGKGQLPIKNGLSIEKYGGYNKLKGAYFCVVEHNHKNKVIRTIEPVYVYKKREFEENPEKYCVEVLGLENPRVIINRILINTVMQLNGCRLAITGRTGDNIVYKHTYQFAVNDEYTKYIKELGKYIERCKASNEIFASNEYVNLKSNEELYDWFIKRLSSNTYSSIAPLKNVINAAKDNRSKFISLDLLQQSNILFELLKTFQCNSVWTSLKILNGKGIVGRIQFSKQISNLESAYIINQSITGLYEKRVDLLK